MNARILDRFFRIVFIFVFVAGLVGMPAQRAQAGPSAVLGTGDGLYAEYFDLGGTTPVLTVGGEGPIDHGWIGSCPGTSDTKYQGVCGMWAGSYTGYETLEESLTGYIEAPQTGHYTFQSWIDDYLDITINGTQQIADDIGGAVYTIGVDMVAGHFYPISMHFKNRGGSGDLSLHWVLPDSSEGIVPKAYLYSDVPSEFKVGLVTDIGGIADQSFNQMAYTGLGQAQTDYGIYPTVYESTSESDYGTLLQQCATDGNGLCFAVGFTMADAVTAAANANTDVNFVLLDYSVETAPANLRVINFNEKQVGYLAGTLAGSMTSSDKIGAVGGMDIPPVRNFIDGYINGAQCANPDVDVTVNYTGTFGDPTLGALVAQSMLASGNDVVYGVAGPTGNGSILYAAQNGAWAIGVDADQYLTVFESGVVSGSDKILTSTMKRLDSAVYETISDNLSGTFSSGQVTYELADDGVALAPYHETDASIPQATKDYVDSVKAGILAGTTDINETCRTSAWEVKAEGLAGPFGLDFDGAGNLYVANEGADYISKIEPDGTISTFSTGYYGPSGLEFNPSGVLFVSDDTHRVFSVDALGVQTEFLGGNAGLANPNAIAFDSAGNLYVANTNGGFISKFAADGTPNESFDFAGLGGPESVVVDDLAGMLYTSTMDGYVYQADLNTGQASIYAQPGAWTDGGLARDAQGNLYYSAMDEGVVYQIDALTQADSMCLAGINRPRGLRFGPDGRLYVTEFGTNRILSVSGCTTEMAPGYQPHPAFGVWFNQNKVDAWNWPYQTDVTLTIEDPSTVLSPDLTWTLNNGWNPQLSFWLDDQSFQLQHGQVVTVTGGGYARVHTITDLVVTEVDYWNRTISGTAAPGSDVYVNHKYDGNIWRHEIAAGDGSWTANFNIPGDEGGEEPTPQLQAGDEYHASQWDEDGDGTNWYLPIYTPIISARLHQNQVHTYGWQVGTELTLTIDDPDYGTEIDYSAVQIAELTDWDANRTFNQFDLGGFTLEPYQVVTITGGDYTRSTTVANLAVTNVDVLNDTVSGTADPGANVHVGHIFCDETGCYGFRYVTADVNGDWIADFAHVGEDPNEQDVVDITPGMENEARIHDYDGDATVYGWYVYNPNFIARMVNNQVDVYDWPAGAEVTLSIDDPATAGVPIDYSAAATAQLEDPGNPASGTSIVFELDREAYLLKSGDHVTVSGGALTKTTIVADIHVSSVDTGADTMSGIAGTGIESVSVRVWSSSEDMVRVATVSDGTWTADFSTPQGDFGVYDLHDGDNGVVRWLDEDGDMTTEYWRAMNPYVEAAPYSNWIHARDWPLGTPITLEIDDPSNGAGVDYTASDSIHQAPWNPGDPNDILAEFNWPDQFTPGPGYIITATGGLLSKTLVVSDLSITSFDLGLDTITGQATPGGRLEVCVNLGDHCAIRNLMADAVTGEWTADYQNPYGEDTETTDLWPGKNGWAADYEEDGDLTWYDWRIPNPNFSARLQENEVHGYEWPIGSTITLIIDDPDYGDENDYQASVTAIPADWDPSQGFAQFRPWQDEFTLELGQILTMTDTITTRTHTVMNLAVTSADPETDTITGTADPGEQVEIGHIWCDETGCHGYRRVFADEFGNWQADFSIAGEDDDEQDIVDLVPGMGNEARVYDDDGDTTQYGWYIPNPRLAVRANYDEIETYEWDMGITITLEINDPGTLEDPDYTETREVDEWTPWGSGETYEWFQLGEFIDIQPGFEVRISDGHTLKTHTVLGLQLTNMDPATDTVSGVAAPGSEVQAWACGESDCIHRYVTADLDGNWMADWSIPGPREDESQTFDIVNGTWVDSQQSDEDEDFTMWGESIPNPRIQAILNENAIEIYGVNDVEVTLTIEDAGTPETPDHTWTGTINDGWRTELGDILTLAAGQTVTLTLPGITKELVIANLDVTGWDLTADTVSGTGPADSQLWAWGWSLNLDANRNITADGSGNWIVDFANPGTGEWDWGTLNLVNGSNGETGIDDDDGDATSFRWTAYTPWIAPESVPLVVANPEYVELARPTYTLSAWAVLNLLYEPLYRVGENGVLVPAAAIGDPAITPDGLQYTFTLRDDLYWSDGVAVTAQDYVNGFLRVLAPETTTDYASLLYYDIVGAEAFNNGSETDPGTVGISAPGLHTLQITLTRPAAHLPQALSVPGFFPIRQDLIDLYGEAWAEPGNFVSCGPYTLQELDGTHILVNKNAQYYGAAEVFFSQIGMPVIPNQPDQINSYDSDELDALINASPLKAGDPLYDTQRVFLDASGMRVLGFNTQRAPTDDVRVRQALVYALDRQALIDGGAFNPYELKATGVIPPAVPGYQGENIGLDNNLPMALSLLADAGYSDPSSLPTIHLYGSPAHQSALEAVAAQWETNLGISVEVHILGNFGSWMGECVSNGIGDCEYNLASVGWYIDYFDAHNILADWWSPYVSHRTGWSSTAYDDQVNLVRAEQDPAQRLLYINEAERILVEDGTPVLPLTYMRQYSLVKPGFTTVFGIVPYYEQWSYHPPIWAVADNYSATEDTLLTITDPIAGLLNNDTNADAEPLWVNENSEPVSGGSLTVNTDGTFSYQAAPNFCGSDSFDYTATDGTGISNTGTVTVGVSCTNDAPKAYHYTVFVEKNVAWPITLVGSDTDGDELTFEVLTQPSHGALSGSAPDLTYTPETNYLGSDSFTYRAYDGNMYSTGRTITIQVINSTLPTVPSSFYGEVHISDIPGLEGSYLQAYIPGVARPVANAELVSSDATLTYMMDIPAGEFGPALEGSVVTFKIDERVVATGTWHSGTQQLLNIHPPAASPAGPFSGDEGTAIDFAAPSLDWGSDINSFEWDWNNDGTYEASGQNPSHLWSDDGDYTIRLRVTDAQGGTGLATFNVTVQNVLPTNVSAGGPYEAMAGQPVNMTGSATCAAGDGCTYAWDLDGDEDYNDAAGLTTTYTWNASGDYTVRFKVTDDDGHYLTNYANVHITGAPHNVSLRVGWNLVSFNVHPVDTSVASVLASISGNYDLVYAWDASGGHTGSGHWMRYMPAYPGLSTLTNLDETTGFWIHMTAADTLELVGNVPSTTNMSLSTGSGGWNLVGYPSVSNRSLPGVLSDHGVGTDFSLVYSYRATEVSDPWKLYNISPTAPDDLTSMSPGWGYWIKVLADHTWSVSYPAD